MSTYGTRPPVALTIAGSDPSGGAGVQGDLKTFSALGAYGCAVITALTAQSTQGVSGTHLVPASFVAEQLETLIADVRLDALKVGMLATAEVADVVGDFLRSRAWPIVVLDPVMVATSGDRLLADDAVDAVRRLLPLASVVTPNTDEAAVLLGTDVAHDVPAMVQQAAALRRAGARRVLLKGGHLSGSHDAVDVYDGPEGAHQLTAVRVDTPHTHGTGCALSSAIAALRPRLGSWPQTVENAKSYLTGAIQEAGTLGVGRGHGPVHHLHRQWAGDDLHR